MLTEAVIFLLIFFISILYIIWQKQNFNYWKRHNIPYIKPIAFLGNLKEFLMFKQSFSQQMWTLYKTKGFEDEPMAGIYSLHTPTLLIRDIDLIKRILIKDFNSFSNRVIKADEERDPLGKNNLFFVRNPGWRDLRPKISPVFTSGKVKQMYPLMLEIGDELQQKLDTLPNEAIIDVKEICVRFTTDLIGTIAFGINANSLKYDSEFYIHSREIFEVSPRRAFEIASLLLAPSLTILLRIKAFSKNTTKFLRSSIKHVIAEREKSGAIRNDLIDTLIAMKQEANSQPHIDNPAKDLDYLVAQAAIFQTAGSETSSFSMAFALYELALQPELQDRLRTEIKEAFERGDGHISYELIHELTYLAQVIDETLRKYPVLGFLERECTAAESGYSLQPFNEFAVPAGMPVYISALGVHRDEKYWPDPDKFDPERFSPAQRDKINWDAYMPFGAGPHNCLGMRIALLQAKLGLICLLKKHRVVVSERTAIPIQFDPKSFLLSSKDGMFLKLEKVTD
ncbi:probable cytochrome P450 6w1 [Teleopsis dalmanni]|uniref:probable cytochrome P450 6w1 n=1 Tax=Teleopsis dalmanni TaxID=139649 RepID=UPI0018CF45AF|nr:probable cytochrome P450 6w1 [Teleopsis dalmanni]